MFCFTERVRPPEVRPSEQTRGIRVWSLVLSRAVGVVGDGRDWADCEMEQKRSWAPCQDL